MMLVWPSGRGQTGTRHIKGFQAGHGPELGFSCLVWFVVVFGGVCSQLRELL